MSEFNLNVVMYTVPKHQMQDGILVEFLNHDESRPHSIESFLVKHNRAYKMVLIADDTGMVHLVVQVLKWQ